jgi:transcriptional adapter 2-alpha
MLRKRIQELQLYRRMGLTTVADIDKYEQDCDKRVSRCSIYHYIPNSSLPRYNRRSQRQIYHGNPMPQIDYIPVTLAHACLQDLSLGEEATPRWVVKLKEGKATTESRHPSCCPFTLLLAR